MPLSTEVSWYFDDEGDLSSLTSDSEDEDEEELEEEPEIRPPAVRAPRPVPAAPALNAPKSTRPSTQSATEKSRARNGLKASTPCLRPPRTVTYSVSTLHDWVDQGLVDLDAEYQRGIVWNELKQMSLIDSLVHNFYIPPIVFAVERRPDGSECRICIDGKQRLTSIHRFSKGDIAHKDSTTNRKSYFINPPGSKKRKLITTQLQANFKNKQLACVEYEDLTPDQEREIFQRVQLGVTLSPADRLPAVNGAYADIVRRLRNRIDTTPGFETYLEWGKARGKDFQALAQIVYLIARGNQPRKAEPQTSRLEAFLALGGDDTASLEETAVNVMDIFCRIVGDPELGRPLHRKLSPLEMVMSGYLIYLYRTKLSDTQLSDAIAYMRKDIKAFAPEPRFNTQNFKRLLNFVSKDVQKLISNLKTAGVKEKPAIQLPCTRLAAPTGLVKESSGVSEFSGPSSSKVASEPVKTTRKRKRPATPEKEESDSDLAMPPKKAPRKSESKLTAEVRNETSRSILEKAAASKKASAARTSVKKALPKGPHGKATLDHLDTSPVVSPGERSSGSTTNSVLGAQVAKPTVKPSSAARTSPAFSQHSGASRSPSVDNPSLLGSAPHPTSTPSAPSPQTSASAVKPPLPGRKRPPGATPPSAMQVEQDFQLPSARSTALPKAAFLFDSSVHVTRAEDLGADAGGVPPPASASSSSSCLPPSPSIHTATTAAKGKLPNIKFNKLRHVSEEDHSSANENEDRWQRGSSALLDSIGGASNAKASSSASPPLRTPQIAQGSSSSSSSPMVSQHVLAPQPPARPNSAGSGAHNPGRPLTPMATPSPTFPYSQPPRNTSSAGVPPPSSATGRQNNMAASSNGASGSNASGPRAARAHPFGLLMRARYHPDTVDVRKRRLEGLQAKLPPRSSFQDNATTSDPPGDAPKRPRANRCRM